MNPWVCSIFFVLSASILPSCGSVVRSLDSEEVQFDDRLEYRDLETQYSFQSMMQDGAVVSGHLVEEVVQAEVRVRTEAMRVPSKYRGSDGFYTRFYTPAQVEANKVLGLPGNVIRGLRGDSSPGFTPVEWEIVDKVEAREDTGQRKTITRPATGCSVSWTLFIGQGQVDGEVETDADGNWRIELAAVAATVSDNIDLYEEGKIVLQPGPGVSSATLRVDFVELIRSAEVQGPPGDGSRNSPDDSIERASSLGILRAGFWGWERSVG